MNRCTTNQGSEDFDDLYADHFDAIFCLVKGFVGDTDQAEDLTQEVFLRVVRSIGGYEGRGLDRAWLFTIARNLLLDRQRSGRRAPDIDADLSPDALPAHGTSPSDAMALDHRGTSPLLMRGADPLLLLREFMGQPDGLCHGMGGHMH